MHIRTVSFQLSVLPKFTTTNRTIYNHLPHVVYLPFMVPFLLQSFIINNTKTTFEFVTKLLSMRTLYVFIQHRLKVKLLVAIQARYRVIFAMVLHVSYQHFLRVEFTKAQITLEVQSAMDFFMFRKVWWVAEGFVAESTLVKGKLCVFA